MIDPATNWAFALDLPTLLVIGAWIAALLGMFLLLAWISDRASRALAWWSTAYIIGGSAVASWVSGHETGLAVAKEIPSALLFLALGMIWTGARLFYGRSVQPLALIAGALVWLIAARWPMFEAGSGRLLLACTGISSYTFLTAFEVWRDRRARPYPRLQATIVPLLHASVFLCPVVLPVLMPSSFGGPWLTALTLATLLYAVGGAFLILAMVQDRNIRIHKDAASTDPLTGLFNRRAFLEAAQRLITKGSGHGRPTTVLMFDLDHFKKINDRFGHAIGDDALRLFAKTASANMRAEDVIGRLGGEEFAAVVPGDGSVAAGIAERIRKAFQIAGAEVSGQPLKATVSMGAAWTFNNVTVDMLLAEADAALYRAKETGRNRLVLAEAPVYAPDANDDPVAAPALDRGRRALPKSIARQIGQTRRWIAEVRARALGTIGIAGMLDRGEQGLGLTGDLQPAELRAVRHPVP
jgi:diguanylate cyclase (GGDEF)-like protein